MAWKDAGLYMIVQNHLHYGSPTYYAQVDPANSSPAQTGFEWENTMNYVPGRPCKFQTDLLAEKKIRFNTSEPRFCDCFAVIEPHSNARYDEVTGEPEIEARLQVRVTYIQNDPPYSEIEVRPYATMERAEVDRWGTSIFGTFTTAVSSQWTFYFRKIAADASPPGGSSLGAASIGMIMLGRSYQFPQNPLLSYPRAAEAGVTQLGREGGSVITLLQSPSRRMVGVRSFHSTDDSRADLESYVAGRRRRLASAGTQLMIKRADIPVAVIMPEMWASSAATYGSCFLARISGFQSQGIVGGQSFSELVFEEVV